MLASGSLLEIIASSLCHHGVFTHMTKRYALSPHIKVSSPSFSRHAQNMASYFYPTFNNTLILFKPTPDLHCNEDSNLKS